MRYSSVKHWYEEFNCEKRTFRDFCWYLYESKIISMGEYTEFIRMEDR